MDNITCLKLVDCPIQGLCNQLYSLVGTLIKAHQNKKNVVIVDNFLSEIWTNNYIPITSILDLNITNIFLKKYNVCIVDSNNIQFKITKILFGNNSQWFDITNPILDTCLNNNILTIANDIPLLSFKGDPCPNIKKKLIVHYQLDGQHYSNTYDELNGFVINNIVFDFNNLNFQSAVEWKTEENINEFNDILKNLVFHSKYTNIANNFIKTLDMNCKTNIIHLRIENDGILWWAHQNRMASEKFKPIIESKYINLIQKYINIKDNTIILCADENNKVIDFLKNNRYNYFIHSKDLTLGREINAIIDLCIGEYCDNLFLAPINCSTFSYTLKNRIKNPIHTISFSLNNIFDKPELDVFIEEQEKETETETETDLSKPKENEITANL